MPTVAEAERALKAVQERIAQDVKTGQAVALDARASELEERAERLRNEAYALRGSARDLRQEVEEGYNLDSYKATLVEARENEAERKAEVEAARLVADRTAWLAIGRTAATDEDFARFCELGLPGLADGNGYPLAHGREERGGEPGSRRDPEPVPAKAMPPKQKVGAFTIRTAEVPQHYSTRTFWVAFDSEGHPLAYMEAAKYGHAKAPDGKDLKTPDGKDALTWPRSKHSAGPKVRFIEALERAFPQAQVVA